MLIKATEQITHISEDKKINSENYFESLSYIDNLYAFINNLKMVINTKSLVLVPTFKGKYTTEKYNIPSTEEENEMRLFGIQSVEFLEDKKIDDLYSILKNYKIDIKENTLYFTRIG